MTKNENAFTLAELMIAVAIVAVVITGMLQLFIYASTLVALQGNKTRAIFEAQTLMEQIRTHDFDTIATDYAAGGTPGDTFTLTSINGEAVVYVTSVNSSLLDVEVVVCWTDKYSRVIGSDLDIDGDVDAGEDPDGDGRLDSIVSLRTRIVDR